MVAAAVFGIGEMLTTSFFLAPFSAGALLAAITDLAGAGEIVSWVVFVVASLLVLGVVRPIARSHMKMPPELRMYGIGGAPGSRLVTTSISGVPISPLTIRALSAENVGS